MINQVLGITINEMVVEERGCEWTQECTEQTRDEIWHWANSAIMIEYAKVSSICIFIEKM